MINLHLAIKKFRRRKNSRVYYNTTPPPQPFYGPFPGPPGWAGARRELLNLWCKGRLTQTDSLTIQMGATPSGLSSAHLHHPPFFTGRIPFLPPIQQCQSTEGNHHHNRFMALFPGPPSWAGARRELLDFMLQGKINRCWHTDHPDGRHSIRTNECPSPHIFYGPDALPATQPTASKHRRQLAHSD